MLSGYRPVFNTASHDVQCLMHDSVGGMQKVPFICMPHNWVARRQSEVF